jgi:hypothetical protein
VLAPLGQGACPFLDVLMCFPMDVIRQFQEQKTTIKMSVFIWLAKVFL